MPAQMISNILLRSVARYSFRPSEPQAKNGPDNYAAMKKNQGMSSTPSWPPSIVLQYRQDRTPRQASQHSMQAYDHIKEDCISDVRI